MTRQFNHHEQQSAEELDQLITALQQGKQSPHQSEDGPMAEQLVNLATSVQPQQQFVKSLRSQLVTQANQKSQVKKGAALPQIIEEWANRFSMKRTLITLAGVTAVIVLAVVGWNLFRPANSNEPAVDIAAITPETAVVEQPAEAIEALPPAEFTDETGAATSGIFEGGAANDAATSSMASIGRGGGGGYGYGPGEGPFVDASITLNADLPTETEAAVYETTFVELPTIDQAAMRDFAEKMGVTGDIYFEWYDGMPVDGQDDGSGNIPYAYRIFNGKRQVTGYLSGELFYENAALYSQNLPPLPYPERAAMAEQFLQERNLLDFNYEIHPGWGNEVQFLTLVDGRAVNNWALLSVNVAGDGQIISVSKRPIGDLNLVQTESLRSAADAWQYLQDNLADGALLFNLIASDPAYFAPQPSNGEKTHWELEFAPGQEVTLNSWIQIFRPADGSITPLLLTDRGIILAADAGTLETIANEAAFGNNVRLQGTLSGQVDNLVLNVANWESVQGPIDVYLNGTTRLVNGIVSLELPGGFPIQLANPPADLPLDTQVSMSSWSVRVADDGVSAIADWVSIDLMEGNYFEPERPVEDPFFNISSVTINKVELAYNYVYPFESLNPQTGIPYIANDNSHLVPFWRFTGETNKGDVVEFMIPAPANVDLPTPITE